MVARDSMRVDAPAAQAELALLNSLKVGDVRQSLLFPALSVEVVWTVVRVADKEWEFTGRFCDVPLLSATIRVDAGLLTLDVEAA